MKKIFTLLFFAAVTAFAASADNDALIDRCINYLLGNETDITVLQAQNMDVNNDGVINITDAIALINANIQEKKAQKAPRNRKSNTQALIDQVLNEEPSSITITTVTTSINEDLNQEQ